jgi:hypothetical protein
MLKEITESRKVPVKEEVDLVVVGGGIAGVSAALAGRRQGLKTMLIEKASLLGGLATIGLIHWYEPLCDGNGQVMTTGIAEELLKLSIRYSYDNLPDQWKRDEEPGKSQKHRYATVFNPSVFSLALNELLIKEGVELRYDMIGSYPVMEGTLCTGIITESTGGREFFPARVLVDATGDADIAARAGIPFRTGSNYLTYVGNGCTVDSIRKCLDSGNMADLDARKFWMGSDLNGKGHPEGLHLFTGIQNEERSEYIRLGQTMLLDKIRAWQKNESCLYSLPGMIQLRKTRCIAGSETFTGEDGIHRNNSIGAAGDFRAAGRHYELPLGILFNDNFPNILAAGRIVSAQGDGWEVARVIPTAALTGEAAGVCASLMVQEKKFVKELSIKQVQGILEKNKVKLHF